MHGPGARIIFIAAAITLAGTADFAAAAGGFRPDSMAYVLQADRFARNRAEALAKLAACDRDLIVIDPTYAGDLRWSAEDLRAMRDARPGRKVVAYLSIGEAENYRAYWQKGWKPGSPAWIGKENPDWRGNFRVDYWHEDWQAIILDELDRIVDAGFDGVYLDLVDAFETFEYDRKRNRWIDNRVNPATGQTFRRDMIDWVNAIAAHARAEAPGFLVIPQNGPQLLEHDDFLATIDLIAVEDLFTDGDEKQSAGETRYRKEFLARATDAGRTVVCVEYPTQSRWKRHAKEQAAASGYTLLITNRNLTRLGECPLANAP